ncbi:DUF317 domain-containing protein [Streptomyces sp. NPDC059070]|uniref:DUF317 domain-containing protein n=1 Tax=Streptomyces sp. NPDC059070 TaxID=3346713 RepID=UPI00367C6756
MSRRQQPGAGWGSAAQPEQHYLIEPRYLAGGGDLRHVAEYLRASGWTDTTRRSQAAFVFVSPDRMLRVAYQPPGGWQIQGAGTGPGSPWQAALSPQTPVEIVAGLTDTLTKARSAHAPNVWAPLAEHGWNTERGHHFTATAPDGNAMVQYVQGEPGQQHWWIGARNEHGSVWNATATPTTPLHLLQGLTTALADPEPVMRPRGHVPPSHRVRTTSVSVLPQQLSAWQQARTAAARAATWARNQATATRSRPARPAAPNARAR